MKKPALSPARPDRLHLTASTLRRLDALARVTGAGTPPPPRTYQTCPRNCPSGTCTI